MVERSPDYNRVIQNISTRVDQGETKTLVRLKKLSNAYAQLLQRLDRVESAVSEGGVSIESHGLPADEVLKRIDILTRTLDDLEMRLQEMETSVSNIDQAQEANALAVEEKITELTAKVDEWEEDDS